VADRKTFDEILDWLKRLERTEVIQRLLPPIEKSRLVGDLARNELAQCADVIAMYQWKGGTNVPAGTPLDDVHFFPGFYWLSWEDAMTNLSVFKKDSRWKPQWLPVFANGGGDFYAVDCEKGSDSLCAVVGFLLGEPEQDIEYETLGSMLETVLDCYRRGAFFVDDRGYLEINNQLHAEIARAHNPSVPLWKAFA
jgi:hypothetical protein